MKRNDAAIHGGQSILKQVLISGLLRLHTEAVQVIALYTKELVTTCESPQTFSLAETML